MRTTLTARLHVSRAGRGRLRWLDEAGTGPWAVPTPPRLRECSMFSDTRATTVVSDAHMSSTSLVFARLARS
jgi:hypothetical protein